ncbi:MAG: hypothetical protein R3A47_06830 [Polyangiales bacterium]
MGSLANSGAGYRWLAFFALWMGSLAAPSTAFAHPVINQAEALIEDGEFNAALEQLRAVESLESLTREDLIDLSIVRAKIWLAFGDLEAMNYDVRRLASLNPDFSFDIRTPPGIRNAFEQALKEVGEGLRLELDAKPASGKFDTTGPRMPRDVTGLVQGISFFHRERSSDPWARTDGDKAQVSLNNQLFVVARGRAIDSREPRQ